jgi:group II intron reverse transcriptase/maturase/CRISPR-associated endonuclease Cas1
MEGKLFPRISDRRTLWKAWRKIKDKGSSGGIDQVTVEDFERNLEANLRRLSEELKTGSYVPEPGQAYFIEKPGSTEKRKITRSTVRDKVVQEAARTVIEPLFESRFKASSYAYRPGRGPIRALSALDVLLRESAVWVAVADIDDFFDSIDHGLLLRMVGERIWEEEVLRLVELWLKMGVMSGLSWNEQERGIPQGSIISPLLSNIYLHPFDCYMEEHKYSMVRYADNFVIVEESKRGAEKALRDAEELLAGELFLRLNPESRVVRSAHEGFVFLGFFHRRGRRTISQGKLDRIQGSIKEMIRTSRNPHELNRRLGEAVRGWREYYGFGDTAEQFEFLDRLIFEEMKLFFARSSCKPGEIRKGMRGLELFLVVGEKEMSNLINLAIAGSRLGNSPARKEPGAGRPAGHDIARKRREYQKKAQQASVLIASSPGSSLGITSKRAVLREGGRKVKETPLFALRHIVVSSRGVSLSSDLVAHCAERGIPVAFLDYRGRPYAHIYSPSHPLYRYSAAQAEASGGARGLYLARCFAEGKIRNQANLLKYYRKYRDRRDAAFWEGCDSAIEELGRLLERLQGITSPADGDFHKARARIFGIEGLAAACYWSQVKALVGRRVFFERREKKGAADLLNSLLNYGYGILYSQVFRAVVLAGLNPNIGFLHEEAHGKPVLVFDMVEEFRQPVVDRTVIALVNRGRPLKMEGDLLDRPTRDLLVRQVFLRLGTPTVFRGSRRTYHEIIEHQVKMLADYLEGRGRYRPFINRW